MIRRAGLDPDDVTLSAWVDFAWAEIVGEAPLMANPFEYRQNMYELFWNGNTPTQREDKDGKEGTAVLTPQSALDQLKAVREQAQKLRQESQAS